MDLFSKDSIEFPDLTEYSKGELTRMEREVTGLYLSGHPMDDYRKDIEKIKAVGIGDILEDYSREGGKIRFRDNQKIVLAGVIEAVKTKPTRNNSLMAYITLDDGTGSIELLAFQRVIDNSGGYMQPESIVIAYGKISERDDKDPQIVLESLRPISDIKQMTNDKAQIKNEDLDNGQNENRAQRTLFVKLGSEEDPEYEHLKLVHMMFPGNERMIIHFNDTKKNVGAKCIIHEAFLGELNTMLGAGNVIIR
jgi:DNA polymerase-3 subunit alpha